jgi:hypothetical protein
MSEPERSQSSQLAEKRLAELINSAFEPDPAKKTGAPSIEETFRAQFFERLLAAQGSHRGWAMYTTWSPTPPPRYRTVAPRLTPIASPAQGAAQEAPSLRLENLADALNDDRYEFRTVESLAEELSVPVDVVREKLDAYPELVRWLPLHDAQGRQLLASRRRAVSWRERLLRVRAYAAKNS